MICGLVIPSGYPQVLWPCRHLRRPLHLSASCMLKGSRLEELLHGWEMVGVLLVHNDENGGHFVSVWVFVLCATPITMVQVVSQRFQDASRSWAQVWQQRICLFSYFSAARCVLSRRSRAALSATYSPAISLVLSMHWHGLTVDPTVHLCGFSTMTTGPMCPAFYRLVPVKSGRLNRRGTHGSFVNDWQVFLWLDGRNN